MKFWPRLPWTKETASLKFEFHRQMCEFLARSKELIISSVKYQISAFKLSLHHLHNRQSITSGTTDCLLIPLALVVNRLTHFFISLLTASHYNFPGLKSAGKWEMEYILYSLLHIMLLFRH